MKANRIKLFEDFQEKDRKEILDQHISQGYKSLVIYESVSQNVVSAANNRIKSMSSFVSKKFAGKGISIKNQTIQPYLNTYVAELNKKSTFLTDLINKKRPAEEIAKVYTSTLINVFNQLFTKEMNWGKRMIVRNMVNKKEMEKYRSGIWLIPITLIREAVDSLPIDEIKKEQITKVLQTEKDSYSFDLMDFAIKTIYG